MISFTLITDTPARLRNQLISRGIIETYTDRNGQQALRGVRRGVEWVEVPNPIVTTLAIGPRYLPNPDYIPAVGEPTIPDPARPGRRIPNPDYIPAVGSPTLGLNPDYVSAVMDQRHVYLVKLAWDAEGDETDGLEQDDTDPDTGRKTRRSLLLRTKLGQWILNNSVPDTLVSAELTTDSPTEPRSWPARNINDNFWLTISDDFGVWQ